MQNTSSAGQFILDILGILSWLAIAGFALLWMQIGNDITWYLYVMVFFFPVPLAIVWLAIRYLLRRLR